jgi:GDP-D-mannose dehydratase
LASISSAQYACKHPIETLHSNGLITANLCDIIHRKGWKTKLFNASSVEIYKGHIDYLVEEENLSHTYNLHPYSIAKIMGQSMVDFYRNTYQLPFSNGILFTTESKYKRPEFLLNKIGKHIRSWKNGEKIPLIVGNLDSYRNIIHASDVASAIHKIVKQEKGDSYLICGYQSHKIMDLVLQLYSLGNIELIQRENILFEKNTGLSVIIMDITPQGLDSTQINIRGESKKLEKIGWKPMFSIDDILEELV